MSVWNKIAVCMVLLCAGLLSPAVQGASVEQAPDVLMQEVTNQVLMIIRQDKAIQAGDSKRILALVEDKVLPHFNFRRMTMLAVGRDWRQANPQQQAQLTEGFRTLLVRTYSNALAQYRDQTIEFKPSRLDPADTNTRIRMEIRQPGTQPILIDYMLEKTPDGWKVFDVIVAGVSLVTNYRSTFTNEIRAGGIDGLIRSIEAKNKSLETGDAAK